MRPENQPQEEIKSKARFLTSSYTLDLQLTKNQGQERLVVRLLDYQNAIIYEKNYADQDIGREINRKIQLRDLVQAVATVSQSKLPNINMNNGQSYKLGQVVKYKEYPCFKVGNAGHATIYRTLIDPNSLKPIFLQSNLKLQQKSAISDLQMEKHRIHHNKQQYKMYLVKQVEQFKKQIKQKIQQSQDRMVQKIIIKMKDLMGLADRGDEQKQKQRGNNRKDEQIQKMYQTNKRQQFSPGNNPQYPMGYLTAISQSNLANFQISGNLIQYIAQNAWTQILFNEYIPMNQSFAYKVNIIRTSARNLMFGVVDYLPQKSARSSYSSNNSICLYNACVYSSKGGQSIKTNYQPTQVKTIVVKISRKDKKISWRDEYSKQEDAFVFEDQILADKNRIFVPYVEMYNQKDIIQYLGRC